MASPVSGVTVVIDRAAEIQKAIHLLAASRVMVGIPATTALRRSEPGQPSTINNAALAYIHEHGSPEANIPARAFLKPGVQNAKNEISAGLKVAARLALEGRTDAVDRQLHRVGMMGRDAVKAKITAGPFVPLKPATIAARRRRSAGSKYRRKATSAADVRPLIDTAQMRNAINYVIRKSGGTK